MTHRGMTAVTRALEPRGSDAHLPAARARSRLKRSAASRFVHGSEHGALPPWLGAVGESERLQDLAEVLRR